MNKNQIEDLSKYKKANKTYKAKLLIKWGYKSQEAYYAAIGAPSKGTKKVAGKPAPVKVKVGKEVEKSTDYVIAFDCTGSMSSYITNVKKHVTKLIEELFSNSKDLQMKIVAFGDYCDAPNGGSDTNKLGSAYQVIELTKDKNALIDFVQSAKNTGGGDEDEFYELVINKINTETKWRDGNRAVLLIGDCEPHNVGYSYDGTSHQIDWKEEAREAKKLGIQYDTLRIHDHITWYAKLSEMTDGVCMNFKNSAKISQVITGSVYARSSKMSFATAYTAAVDSGDTELIGAYKSMSTLSSLKD